LIGCAMAVNLLAAHAVRFKLQARDWLARRLAVIAAGIGLLVLVVVVAIIFRRASGQPVEWPTLWTI